MIIFMTRLRQPGQLHMMIVLMISMAIIPPNIAAPTQCSPEALNDMRTLQNQVETQYLPTCIDQALENQLISEPWDIQSSGSSIPDEFCVLRSCRSYNKALVQTLPNCDDLHDQGQANFRVCEQIFVSAERAKNHGVVSFGLPHSLVLFLTTMLVLMLNV